MKALSQMSRQLRDLYNVLVKHQQNAGNGYESLAKTNRQLQMENQQLRSEADSHKKQAAASRQALSIATSRMFLQDQEISNLSTKVRLLEQLGKEQGAGPADCKATPATETQTQKRQRSDDEEQGMREDAEEGSAKRRSTWLGQFLNDS